MCGIVGFISDGTYGARAGIANAYRELLVIDSLRGFDSTGHFYKDKKGKVWYRKEATTGSQFVSDNLPKRANPMIDCRFAVGHNRAATVGDVTEELAHPFAEGTICGVHNGTIQSWRSYWPQYKDAGSDSAALYKALSTVGPDDDSIKEFLEEIVSGAYTLVWHDSRVDELRIVRNDQRPMNIAMTDEGLLFASESSMLEFVAKRNTLHMTQQMFSLDPYCMLSIPVSGEREARITKIDRPVYSYSGSSTRRWWEEDDDDYWFKPKGSGNYRTVNTYNRGATYGSSWHQATNRRRVDVMSRYGLKNLERISGSDDVVASAYALLSRLVGKDVINMEYDDMAVAINDWVHENQKDCKYDVPPTNTELPVISICGFHKQSKKWWGWICFDDAEMSMWPVLLATTYSTNMEETYKDIGDALAAGYTPLVSCRLRGFVLYSDGQVALEVAANSGEVFDAEEISPQDYPQAHPELECPKMPTDWKPAWVSPALND